MLLTSSEATRFGYTTSPCTELVVTTNLPCCKHSFSAAVKDHKMHGKVFRQHYFTLFPLSYFTLAG